MKSLKYFEGCVVGAVWMFFTLTCTNSFWEFVWKWILSLVIVTLLFSIIRETFGYYGEFPPPAQGGSATNPRQQQKENYESTNRIRR